mmetsp:Transcript_13146/g.22691  ORF Transcript_13146/g.22691 Transcript_13146/m.22691 type:complete len:222 (+) Transcript_13146:531-1196(+)
MTVNASAGGQIQQQRIRRLRSNSLRRHSSLAKRGRPKAATRLRLGDDEDAGGVARGLSGVVLSHRGANRDIVRKGVAKYLLRGLVHALCHVGGYGAGKEGLDVHRSDAAALDEVQRADVAVRGSDNVDDSSTARVVAAAGDADVGVEAKPLEVGKQHLGDVVDGRGKGDAGAALEGDVGLGGRQEHDRHRHLHQQRDAPCCFRVSNEGTASDSARRELDLT